MLLALVQLFVYLTATLAAEPEEPVCPKFYYEEKTLEKVVRLEHRLELQEKTIQTLEEKVDNQQHLVCECETTPQGIDDELKNKLPYVNGSVIFLAKDVAKEEVCRGEVVRYTDLQISVGGGYDINTGYFTAPISGAYTFSAHVCSKKDQAAVLAIVKNEVIIASTVHISEDNYGTCMTFGAIDFLSKGDKVAVKGNWNCRSAFVMTNVYRVNTFSGRLISIYS